MTAIEKSTQTHPSPVWRHRANFIVQADLTPHGLPGKWEQLWCRRDGDEVAVCCVPFFVYAVALGDVAALERGEEFEFVLGRVIRASGRQVVRVAVADETKTDEVVRYLADALRQAEFLFEWASVGYVAVDVADASARERLTEILEPLITKGAIEYENA